MQNVEKPATDHPSAERFEKVRQEHRNETAEDYVELIAELIDRRGEARAVDLSARLGVSQPTVNKVITRLRRDGLVEGRRYRSLFLTDEGRHLAEAMRRRHRIVLDFLLSLGISEEVAHADAEGIEHHVSDETLEAFRRGTRRTAGRDAGQASS